MSRRLATPLLVQLLLSAALAACSSLPRQTPPPGGLIPGPILTFPYLKERDGIHFSCAEFAAARPVRGTFEGDPMRSSQVAWLRGAGGRQLTVAWPEGFTVRFEPDAVLYNERGQAVARHGQQVELGQVNVEAHAGTFLDPYIASGTLFDGCYPVAR